MKRQPARRGGENNPSVIKLSRVLVTYHVNANHSLVYFKMRKTSPQLWVGSDLVSVKLVLHICEVCSPPTIHFLPVLSKCEQQKHVKKKNWKSSCAFCPVSNIYLCFSHKIKFIFEDVNIYSFFLWSHCEWKKCVLADSHTLVTIKLGWLNIHHRNRAAWLISVVS